MTWEKVRRIIGTSMNLLTVDAGARMLEQTRASIGANYAMVASSRYHIAASRRRLNPWFAFTGGSDTDGFRTMVRARLSTGALFRLDGTRAWASQGEDKPCVVCGEAITRAQVEYEVSGAVAGTTARAHLRCYLVWREESQLSSPLRPAADPRGLDADPLPS